MCQVHITNKLISYIACFAVCAHYQGRYGYEYLRSEDGLTSLKILGDGPLN